MADKSIEIIICMGSSCFARGNEENLRVIENFMAENQCEDKIALSGRCCVGHCAEGPNIIIDGLEYHHIGREALIDLLNEKLKSL